jgi:hypothetical protein
MGENHLLLFYFVACGQKKKMQPAKYWANLPYRRGALYKSDEKSLAFAF